MFNSNRSAISMKSIYSNPTKPCRGKPKKRHLISYKKSGFVHYNFSMNILIIIYSIDAKYLSASRAAIHPVPAAVTA